MMPEQWLELPNIELSIDRNLLWPPLADALSTFIRRRAAQADHYELTWRLIHVWEAAAAALTGALCSRLRTLGEVAREPYLRAREHLHGRNWDPLSKTYSKSASSLDGSANRRLDLLLLVDGVPKNTSRFIDALRSFLDHDGISLTPLVISWKQVCDVPKDISASKTYKVRDVFRHVNAFRNRFAHVPFPYDELAPVAEALTLLTEELFTIQPTATQMFSDSSLESPLAGAIALRGRLLRGNVSPANPAYQGKEPMHVYPANPRKPSELVETWSAVPFISVNDMFRPHVLTRLLSEANGLWEYTRFQAERNSVIRVEDHSFIAMLPPPSSSDYPTPADELAEEQAASANVGSPPKGIPKNNKAPISTDIEFERALRNIANEEYEAAIKFFGTKVAERPNYHVGWLRLGHAQREQAMRLRFTNQEDAIDLFRNSIDSLSKAGEHFQSSWKAQALYERSKTKYQLHKLIEYGPDRTQLLEEAISDAETAYLSEKEPRYGSWVQYLIDHA